MFLYLFPAEDESIQIDRKLREAFDFEAAAYLYTSKRKLDCYVLISDVLNTSDISIGGSKR